MPGAFGHYSKRYSQRIYGAQHLYLSARAFDAHYRGYYRFTLASQDLDIRGAGNLLGEEQSGQMRDVGYELYQQMLEDAIAKIRSGETEVGKIK